VHCERPAPEPRDRNAARDTRYENFVQSVQSLQRTPQNNMPQHNFATPELRNSFSFDRETNMRILARCLMFCAVLFLGAPLDSVANAQDRVIQVPTDDQEMQRAMTSARASLAEFWKTFDTPKPGEEGFALKVAIIDGSKVEHFWVNRIERSGQTISGIINNDPNDVTTVKLGQRVEFPTERISDWMFLRNSKIVGNATLRVLMKFMPKDQADQYRVMLEPTR
jgi:uncharacterized protein YegJ (DUF2314 family)